MDKQINSQINFEESKDFYRWVSWVSAIMLLIAIPTFLPYGYYQFLRIVIMLSALVMSAVLNTYGLARFLAFVFLFMGILFNAFFPIHLEKEVWVWIDLVSAILFIYVSFKFLKDKKEL